ncbi:MAG: hypothetical protein ACYC5N_11860, partial [Endomicrobiales bacterium]
MKVYNDTLHRRLFPCLAAALLALPAAAAGNEPGGTRARGMGAAFTALSGDVEAAFYNPAGLAALRDPEIVAGFGSVYSAGTAGFLGSAVFALPAGKNVFGMHANGSQSGDSGAQEAGVSFAGKLFPFSRFGALRFGTAAKWRADSASGAQMYLADLGLQKEILPGRGTAGIAVRNIFSGDVPAAPLLPSAGFSYDTRAGIVSADLTWKSRRVYASAGFERALYRGLMLMRLGFHGDERSFVTAGVSACLWPVGFDTSFSWPVDDKSGGQYQLALRYRFGGEDFSEVYLTKTLEKTAVLERRIRQLESRRRELSESLGNAALAPERDEGPAAPPLEKAPAPKREIPEAVRQPVPLREETPAPRAKKTVEWPQFHQASAGDTLRELARKYY